ncbi:MAG: hypothetical protein U9N73_01480, partial [Candidatus Auribacterota bacterium]|nr:hypothetical protein [Candidatus Auribacterota bacterium]
VYAGIVIINNCRSLKKATPGLLYLLLGASLFAVSFIGRGNINSYINTLLPMSLALALLSGWAWGNTLPRKIEIPRKPFTIPHSLFPTMISLLIVVQFMALFYSPFRYIPTTKDRRAGERLIALMENSEGPILLPFHGYLPQLAGKEPSAHWTAVLDLLLAMKEEDDDPARVWLDQLIAALEEGRYEKIILDREDWFPDLLKLRYRKAGEIFSGSRIFFPVTGYPWRPQYRYNRIFPEEKF